MMAKPERLILTPIPMQYRHPAVTTCPACMEPIYIGNQHYVESRANGMFYCDNACLLEDVSRPADDDRFRWFEGELVPAKQILVELEVASYG